MQVKGVVSQRYKWLQTEDNFNPFASGLVPASLPECSTGPNSIHVEAELQ